MFPCESGLLDLTQQSEVQQFVASMLNGLSLLEQSLESFPLEILMALHPLPECVGARSARESRRHRALVIGEDPGLKKGRSSPK